MVKRTYGSGSSTEVTPGRFRLRLYVRDPETRKGRQVSKTVQLPARGNRKALEAEMRTFREEVAERTASGRSADFSALLRAWLEDLPRQRRATKTIETYTLSVRKHVTPTLGKVPLGELDAYRLDRLYAKLERDGLSTASVRHVHSVISSALAQGLKWGWVSDNVARRATPPRLEREDRHGLTVADLKRLLTAAEETDSDLAAVIALGAMTGCRRGELVGLRWSDVDWEAKTLKVERAWVPGKGGQHLTTTKTKKARTVPLGSVGVGVLRRYRAKRDADNGSVAADSWLLAYGDGSVPLRAKSVSENISRLGQKLEPPLTIHFHDLRHFAGSEMLGAGVDLKTAASILGHSPTVLAEIYAHSSDERKARAAEALGLVVAQALEGPVDAQTPPGR